MDLRFFIVGVGLSAVGGGIFYATTVLENSSDAVSSASLDETQQRWTERIRQQGASLVYEDFVTETRELERHNERHAQAHKMGEVLWEVLGIEGVAVCDASFQFGCYHDFFGRAITERGLAITEQLAQACGERWSEGSSEALKCQHGIGHGLVTYFGYDESGLSESLQRCGLVSPGEEIGGCLGGVFMEYNQRTMIGSESAQRELADDAHAPCSRLPQEYVLSCYYNQAVWWKGVYEEDYGKAGEHCGEVGDEEARSVCYQGLGGSLGVNTDYNIQEAHEACSRMPSEEGEILCLSAAAISFAEENEFSGDAGVLCEQMEQSLQDRCLGQVRRSKEGL